jgi:hypothetical protein
MKKLILALIVGAILMMAGPVMAASLAWDHPEEWDVIEGYIVYFTDGTAQFQKTILRSELVTDGVTVFYENFANKLNLHFGVEYTIHVTAYNAANESGPSNEVFYERTSFLPPADQLPEGVIINIPNVPVTINIQ